MIKPWDYLYSLVDSHKVHQVRSQARNQEQWVLTVWVCDEILEWWSPVKHPRTIEETRSYLQALTSNICWAKHERYDNGITVNSCKMRECNVACLHWVEFTRHPLDWNLRFWTDMWSTRVFAVAYVLNELWYHVPTTIDNIMEVWWKMIDFDQWEPNWNLWEERYNDNDKTKVVQRELSDDFFRKYINPIKTQFDIFWDTQVTTKSWNS